MKTTLLKAMSALLAALMIAASLSSCDNILNGDQVASSEYSEESPKETNRKPSSNENKNDDEDNEDGETDKNDEELTVGNTDTETTSDTVDTAYTTDTADTTDIADATDTADTDGEASEAPESERFDYMNSDMSDYISVDESLYKNTSVKLPVYLNGTDEAVSAYIQVLLEYYSVSTGNKIVDQPIKEGDSVAIYYEGWLNGEKFAGGSNMSDANPYMLVIGSGTFIPGFEEGLVGVVPNTTSKESPFDLHVTFPENYQSAELAGKIVVFKVYVVYIEEKVPAEYTDEFITKTIGYKTTETNVKADFEKHLKEEYLPEQKRNEIINAIWQKLAEKSTVSKYPENEIAYFYSSYENQYKMYYQYYSSMFSSFEAFMSAYMGANWKATLEEQSELDVKQNLIFHAIAQAEGLTVTDDDYRNAVQYYIDYYLSQGQTVTAEQIEENIGERMIKEQALWDKVNELIVANCTPTYE
jgi:trigger factor